MKHDPLRQPNPPRPGDTAKALFNKSSAPTSAPLPERDEERATREKAIREKLHAQAAETKLVLEVRHLTAEVARLAAREADLLASEEVLRVARDAAWDALAALRERIEAALFLAPAWPVTDVLTKLAEAAEILLNRKDYDGHGWELIQGCVPRAREYAAALRALASVERGAPPQEACKINSWCTELAGHAGPCTDYDDLERK